MSEKIVKKTKTILKKTPAVAKKSILEVPLYDMEGKKVGTMELPSIFNSVIKEHLVHKSMMHQRFNKMISSSHTKTRAERRGGGKKPWKQKGTGRARFGSSRNPIWRKGGVAFGPTNEISYAIRMPKKEKRIALLSVLTDKFQNNQLTVLKDLKMSEIKTKKLEEIILKLNLTGKILLIINKKDENLEKSAKNLSYLKLIKTENINILDLLKYEILLSTKDGILKLAETFKEKV
jgi:large subunit ribosomal protein L4